MKTVTLVNIGGKSHPDLLKGLTEKSVQLGASWLNSKVNYLAGYVSALIKIEVDSNKLEDLKEVFTQTDDITACFYDSPDELADIKTKLKLKIDAEDRSGLVNELIHFFHDTGIKVLNLDSHRLCAFGLGQTMFTADISLSCPPEVQLNELTQGLKALSNDMKISVLE